MQRRRITVRGVDEDALEKLREVRRYSGIETVALLSDAIRFWYSHPEETDPDEEED